MAFVVVLIMIVLHKDALTEFANHVEKAMTIYAMENHAFKIKIVYHKLANMGNALNVPIVEVVNTVITIHAKMIIIAFLALASIKYVLNAHISLLPFVLLWFVKVINNVPQTYVTIENVDHVQNIMHLSAMVLHVLPIIHAALVFALIINVILAQLSKVFNAIINPAIITLYVTVAFVIRVFAFHAMIKKNLMHLFVAECLAIQISNVPLEPALIHLAFYVILQLVFIVQNKFAKEIMTVLQTFALTIIAKVFHHLLGGYTY
jgi:hypothetical protein